jgi:hypothetical protein
MSPSMLAGTVALLLGFLYVLNNEIFIFFPHLGRSFKRTFVSIPTILPLLGWPPNIFAI